MPLSSSVKTSSRRIRTPATKRRARTPWDLYPYATLRAWIVAEQSYCEQRVHLWLNDPGERVSIPRALEQETEAAIAQAEAADLGRAVHSLLLDASPLLVVEETQSPLSIRDKCWVTETLFRGSFADLPIEGIPDAVCVQHGKALSVIELKVTESNQLQMSHRVQLLTYGYLLEQNGFNVSDLLLTCVLIPPANNGTTLRPEGNEELLDIFLDQSCLLVEAKPSCKNWSRLGFSVQAIECVHLRTFRYEPERARSELQFFVEYWSGQRAPYPTKKAAKCERCLYNSLNQCKSAVAPYRL
jgi:CRISPR/Cas system-associated exonuclease Cas4 (RecB family)